MEHPPATATRPRRLSSALLIILIAFATGIAATFAFVRYYSHLLPPAMQPELPASSAPATPARFTPPPERGTGQSAESEAVALRQRGLAADLANLEARALLIDREAQGAASQAGRAEALLIAMATRRAVERGTSLAAIEPALRARFGSGQPRAVAVLHEAGRMPVTLYALRAGLDEVESAQLGSDISGFWAGLQQQLGSLIIIHREGTPSPRPAARLERIRRALDSGQIELALAEARRLPAGPALQRWLADAKRYVEAQQALDVIEQAALQGQITVAAPVALPVAPASAPAPATAPPQAGTGAPTTPQR